MILAVLDANVVASGILGFSTATSPPVLILRAWLARSFVVVNSAALQAEIENTLLVKPYFAGRVSTATSTA